MTNVTKSLVQISNFGAIDADNDSLLLDCFEDHEAFTSIIDYSKFLVVGKKGSGKTAIFKKLQSIRKNDFFCYGHTFSDYPWHHHDLQARQGIPDHDKFTHSWKYLILMTIAKIALNNDNSISSNNSTATSLKKIRAFISDTYGTTDPDVAQIFTPTKVFNLKAHFEINFKILKTGVEADKVPMSELPVVIQEVNLNLSKYILNVLNSNNSYHICFDQLDLGFDLQNGDYANRLIGLILAARDINLMGKENGKKLFVSIFLRDDIFNTLKFEDKNKITENSKSVIEWDTDRTNKTLKGLMEKRFVATLGGNPKWEDLFDESKKMAGHQTKYQHILDRTYLRPRDIIKFTNSILTKYRIRHLEDPASSVKIQNVDINGARSDYSYYLQEELDDEIYKHMPHAEDALDILRTIGNWQFTYDVFQKNYNLKPIKSVGAREVLQQLFDFSLIGFYRSGGRGYGGSEYVFKYKETRSKFDATSIRFRIHPGLIEVLGLKRLTAEATN